MWATIKNDVVNYILVYFLLLTKTGFLFYEKYSAVSTLLLLFVGIAIFIRKKATVNQGQVYAILIVFTCIIFTSAFKGMPEINKFLLIFCNLITALVFVSIISYEKFSRCFSNIIYIICIISLIGHILFLFGIPVVTKLPVLTNSLGRSVYFAGLAEFWTLPMDGTYRLQGIFWEPGAFQTMIVIAFLLDLYINKPTKKVLRYLCYGITVFFTYSTTGLICIPILLVLLAVKGRKIRFKSIISLIIVAGTLGVIVPLFSQKFEGFLYYSTFGKLHMLNDAYMYGEDNAASSRFESVVYPLRLFLKSPILGIGEQGLDEIAQKAGHNMFTCTPVNYFAVYGLLCGLICSWGFIRLIRLKNKSLLESVVLLSLLLITTSSENFAFNPVFTCFMLFGFSGLHFNRTSYTKESFTMSHSHS